MADKNEYKMSEEARKAQATYSRSYRARNKDKVRQWNKNYWSKKANQSGVKDCNISSSDETLPLYKRMEEIRYDVDRLITTGQDKLAYVMFYILYYYFRSEENYTAHHPSFDEYASIFIHNQKDGPIMKCAPNALNRLIELFGEKEDSQMQGSYFVPNNMDGK